MVAHHWRLQEDRVLRDSRSVVQHVVEFDVPWNFNFSGRNDIAWENALMQLLISVQFG